MRIQQGLDRAATLARQSARREARIAAARQDIGYGRLTRYGERRSADRALSLYEKNLKNTGGRNTYTTPEQRLQRDVAEAQRNVNTKELTARQREEMRKKGQEQYRMQGRARRRSRGARSLLSQVRPTQGALGSAGTLG